MNDIQIHVDPAYIDEQSDELANRFVFAYTITIENTGLNAAQLISREWLIADGNGKIEEVVGDGVVGEQPLILPGETYRYTSGAILETDVGTMQGKYHMLSDTGETFEAFIPEFVLSVPRTLH